MKTTSEFIAWQSKRFMKKRVADGRNACQIMVQTGFIGSMESDGELSENGKDYLGGGHKSGSWPTPDSG
jgi:hypothetical protein